MLSEHPQHAAWPDTEEGAPFPPSHRLLRGSNEAFRPRSTSGLGTNGIGRSLRGLLQHQGLLGLRDSHEPPVAYIVYHISYIIYRALGGRLSVNRLLVHRVLMYWCIDVLMYWWICISCVAYPLSYIVRESYIRVCIAHIDISYLV